MPGLDVSQYGKLKDTDVAVWVSANGAAVAGRGVPEVR
jgi:hypothetical protein